MDIAINTVIQFLAANNACRGAAQWAASQSTLHDVWHNCRRPEWLIWLAQALDIDITDAVEACTDLVPERYRAEVEALRAKQTEHADVVAIEHASRISGVRVRSALTTTIREAITWETVNDAFNTHAAS